MQTAPEIEMRAAQDGEQADAATIAFNKAKCTWTCDDEDYSLVMIHPTKDETEMR